MLYKTHKAAGVFSMLVAFEVMKTKGMLMPNVNEIVQLAVMYPAASWGSTAPDLDHGISSVKEQTPFNLFVHRLLHLTNPKHRSWQTHSLYFTLPLLLVILALVYLGDHFFGGKDSFEWVFIMLVCVGATVGALSHLIMDALSTGGIWVTPKVKLRFVPKSSFFATGSSWEKLIYSLLMVGIVVVTIEILLGVYGYSLLDLKNLIV